MGRRFASVRKQSDPALHEFPAALQVGLGWPKARGVRPKSVPGVEPRQAVTAAPRLSPAAPAVELAPSVSVHPFPWILPATPRGGHCSPGSLVSPDLPPRPSAHWRVASSGVTRLRATLTGRGRYRFIKVPTDWRNVGAPGVSFTGGRSFRASLGS